MLFPKSQILSLVSLAPFVLTTPVAEPRAHPTQYDPLYNGKELAGLAAKANIKQIGYSLKHRSSNGCNVFNTAVRTEFRKMPKYMRKQYTDAVTCLYSQKSHLNGNSSYPGVKNRYDDYPAGHIEFDQFNHFSGNFFFWHRYVIWTFEQDLRNKCGYRGYLPYWDWGLDAQAPQNSEIFNGDEYSMGSNGAYIPSTKDIVFTVPLPDAFLKSLPNPQVAITVPAGTGTGGGCISKDGPFGNAEAHLGPTILGAYGTTPTGLTGLFKYQPRCIKRDLNPFVTSNYATYKNITEAVTNYTNIGDFQAVLQSDSRYAFTIGNPGVHAAGHIGCGGDPMADQPSTPGDPMWFLHHAQMDRLWYIWQNQDPETRLKEVATTHTNLNYPPSADVTLDDTIDLAYIGGPGSPPKKLSELASTVDGPFCYKYI